MNSAGKKEKRNAVTSHELKTPGGSQHLLPAGGWGSSKLEPLFCFPEGVTQRPVDPSSLTGSQAWGTQSQVRTRIVKSLCTGTRGTGKINPVS